MVPSELEEILIIHTIDDNIEKIVTLLKAIF